MSTLRRKEGSFEFATTTNFRLKEGGLDVNVEKEGKKLRVCHYNKLSAERGRT